MKILYISVDNRCRSILAEAITHHVSEGLVTPYSAGTHPDQSIYPAVYGFLRERGIETLELQTKDLDQVTCKISADDIDIVVLLSAALDRDDIAKRFHASKLVVLPIDDLSHGNASDDQLHSYFENIVDTIEFRLRKAIIASEKPASADRGRFIEDKQKFIEVYCNIADDDIEDGSTDKTASEESKGDKNKAEENAEKNEEVARAQTAEDKDVEKAKGNY